MMLRCEIAFCQVEIGTAHPRGEDTNTDFARSGLRDRTFDLSQRRRIDGSRFGDDPCAHLGHGHRSTSSPDDSPRPARTEEAKVPKGATVRPDARGAVTEDDAVMRILKSRWLRRSLFALAIVVLTLQLVPYRVSNPTRNTEPPWDSPRTRALAVAACFDCHSNRTHVTWFEQVAPLSWWIKSHVDDGRNALNFSEWSRRGGEGGGDAAETTLDGSMPPPYYTWLGMHSNADLTPAQRKELAAGLRKTFATPPAR